MSGDKQGKKKQQAESNTTQNDGKGKTNNMAEEWCLWEGIYAD